MERIARSLFRFCQCLAILGVFCQALAIPSAAAADAPANLNVRWIQRKTNVQNLDRVDTIKWYAPESIRYEVTPCYRDGSPVAIPADATALWMVAKDGTNYLAANGEIANGVVTFAVDAGHAALPGDGRGESYACLWQGTNLLGVIDRANALCIWAPDDDVTPLEPITSRWDIVIARLDELDARFGSYIAKTNGEWVIVQDTAWNGIEWNGTRIFGADLKIQTNPGGRILSIDGIADGTISLSVWAAEDGGTLEASADLETWEACESAAWTADESSPNLWHVTAPTDGDVQFFRVATAGGVPDIREAVVRAYAPLYLNGGTGCRDLAATAGDVEDLRRDMHGELDGYAPLTGYEHDESLVPGERRVAWDLSPTGSTFNAVNLGGDLRTNWPGFKTGGPLFPFFVQATGVVARGANYYIPTGPEADAGGARAVPVAKENASWYDTSAAGFVNIRHSPVGEYEPCFPDTETMRWGTCEFDSVSGTGFWWQVAGPVTGEWAVAIGSYTGRTTVAKTSAASSTSAWGWRGNVPGSLRESLTSPLEALAAAEGKSTDIWVDRTALATTNAVRNPDFWAADMDLTCVSTWCNNNGFTYTAITSRHFLTASHCHPAIGDEVTWYAADGTPATRTIAKQAQIGGHDCWLCELDSDLPESIVPARIVHPDDLAVYFAPDGLPFVSPPGVRGHRVAALHPTRYGGRLVWFDLDLAAVQEDAATERAFVSTNAASAYSTFSRYDGETAPFIGGDSGSPVLLWDGTQTIIVETLHTADGSGPNISLLAPAIRTQVRSWGGDDLQWADWPEPNTNTETTP